MRPASSGRPRSSGADAPRALSSSLRSAHSGEAARRRRAQLRAEPEVQREGRVEDAARVAKGVPVSGPDRAAPRRRLSIFPAILSSSLLFCYSHLQRTASHRSKRAREREAEVGSGALPWLVVRRSWLSLLTRRLSHPSTAAIEGTAQLDSRSELQSPAHRPASRRRALSSRLALVPCEQRRVLSPTACRRPSRARS